jgi:hypothetical protein
MTGTEVKKNLKLMERDGVFISKIHVSIYECGTKEFDVNVNIWYLDKWNNSEFECFTDTLSDKNKAIAKAKRIAKTLLNNGYKAEYTGIENA